MLGGDHHLGRAAAPAHLRRSPGRGPPRRSAPSSSSGSAMQRAISPASAPSSACDRELGARGVDDRDQRQPELLGQPHAAAGLAQRGRPHRGRAASGATGPGRPARTAARRAGSASRARLASCSPSSVPLSRTVLGRAVPQQVAYAEPVRSPGQLHRLPRRPVRRVGVGSQAAARARSAGSTSTPRARSTQLGQVLGGDDRVDHALLGEVLGRAARRPGTGAPLSASYTFGPRKPTSAPGSATVTCPSEPHDA